MKRRLVAGLAAVVMVSGCGSWLSSEPQPWVYEGVRASFKVPKGWMTRSSVDPQKAYPGPLPGEGTLVTSADEPLRYEGTDTFDGRQVVFTLGAPGYLLQSKAACFISTFSTDRELPAIMAADEATIRRNPMNRITDTMPADLPEAFPLRSFTYAHRAPACSGMTTLSHSGVTNRPWRTAAVIGVPEWCDLVVSRYYWAKQGVVHVMEIDRLPGVLDRDEVRRIAEGFTAK